MAAEDGGAPPTPTTPPATPPAAPPATPPTPPPAAKPNKARDSLEAIRAKRAATTAAKAPKPAEGAPAAPAIPDDVANDAKAWKAYVKNEGARIAKAAETLDAEDQALIAGEPDVTRKAALLARLSKAAAPESPAPKVTAKPKAAGGPPPSSAVDFAEAFKDPKAWAEAKARDPEGSKKWFAALGKGRSQKSTFG